MKRFLIAALLIIAVLGLGGYYLYRTFMPAIVAEVMVSDSLPGYVPKRFKAKVEAIKKPINKGTEAIIVKMHESEIPMERILAAVDNITEEQLFAFLEEVDEKPPSTLDEVFDVAKKHFQTDIDLEVFRDPFVTHFDIEQVRNALAYANVNRKRNDIDMATAKTIVKMILVEKENEMRGR